MPYIHSPCTNQCQLNEDKVCLSCHRTLEEISVWSRANNEQKQRILDRLEALKGDATETSDTKKGAN